jgi:hypothetical protein
MRNLDVTLRVSHSVCILSGGDRVIYGGRKSPGAISSSINYIDAGICSLDSGNNGKASCYPTSHHAALPMLSFLKVYAVKFKQVFVTVLCTSVSNLILRLNYIIFKLQ